MSPVRAFLEKARKKLVDTSMRNRLLNYVGGTRTSAVEIVDEQPAALWNALVIAGRRLQVRGRDPDDVSTAPDDDPGGALDDVDGVEEAVEPERDRLTSTFQRQHLDEFLQTGLTPEVLNTRLRRLADVAREAEEEQGVETLFVALGLLHYFETEDSETERRAPLLLVPAKLSRAGPARWTVGASDAEPLVNPALVEYLETRHRIRLPEVAADDFDAVQWFADVESLIAAQRRWRLSARCVIGNFSFHKFVMHEDLKRNADVIAAHPVVDLLARRSGESAGLSALPPEVRDIDLDTAFAPEDTFQVVDADATQQRALAAVATGKNLVIHGPPGTGKSQTITNLIAGALATGKSVLFVAEKQAALNVVFDRLKKAGLGDFCLELHSTKANKKVLIQEVKRAWDAAVTRVSAEPEPPARLAQERRALTAYVRALHTPVAPLGLSPFEVMGRLLRLRDVPDVRVSLQTAGVTRDEFERAVELLGTLAEAAARLSVPLAQHPWRGSDLSQFRIEQQERLEGALGKLRSLLREIIAEVADVTAAFGVKVTSLEGAAEALTRAADVFERSPGVPRSTVAAPDWTKASESALALVERVRTLQQRDQETKGILATVANAEALAQAVQLLIARGRSIWAWFSAEWWSARRILKAAVSPTRWAGAYRTAVVVDERLKVEEERRALDANSEARNLFGQTWRGADSDWRALEGLVRWVELFRDLAARLSIGSNAYAVVETASPDVAPMRRLAARCQEAVRLWKEVRDTGGWPAEHLQGAGFEELADWLDALWEGRDLWREMKTFQTARASVSATVARPMVDAALAGEVPWSVLPRVFERRFLRLWLDEVEANQPVLGHFDGKEHASRIDSFRLLDKQALEVNKERTIARLRRRTVEEVKASPKEAKVIRDQVSRTRGHLPVRQFVQSAFAALRAIKPCFLMSPMAVAQTLPPEPVFDVVVFDEASQLTCEDAIGAVARGRQLVVVGDPRQLPPTNFFAVQLGEVEAQKDEDGEERLEDLESILELAQAAGFHAAQLRWHYRSRHESLIAFSNRNFYDSSLLTFPSPDRSLEHVGVSFEFVGGRYEGKGVNTHEAERVVEAVVQHARTSPHRSLGVGTFSLAQQIRIQDILERRRRDDPVLDAFLALDKAEPFFVKNLENIQGDERDVIFLSVTYGPAEDGKIRYNFGPLNGESGWRRLNVLTTRARQQMRVFSSLRADDMRVGDDRRGAVLLRDFLRYAETGSLVAGPMVRAAAETESPFEREVMEALREKGVEVVPQVGVAGYRIDLGVVDHEVPGRFVCGIECDGATYHSAETARDRDRLREEVLRGLGWELHRVWSTDWWHHREREVRRLLERIEGSRRRARQRTPEPPPGANAPQASAEAGATEPPPVADSAGPSRRQVRPPQFPAYRVAELPRQSGNLVDASTQEIRRLIRRVVEVEGPVHEEMLRARLIAAFGHQRAGARMNERLDRALTTLRGDADFVQVEHWWRLKGQRVVARRRGSGEARPEHVSPEEYRAALVAALEVNDRLREEELAPLLRDAFGFGAATPVFRSRLEAAIRELEHLGQIVHTSEGYALRRS